MAKRAEPDPILADLANELRVAITTLNDLHHPVYPVPDSRIRPLERRVEELREAMHARRVALNDEATAASAASSSTAAGSTADA